MVKNSASSGKKKTQTPSGAYIKISHYCAYQERSHHEVRSKLFDYGLFSSEVEEIISKLITDGFLNEERFAKAFAGGKFRMKKWGRIKIEHELEAHKITPRCIRKGLEEIDEKDYANALKDILTRKLAHTEEPNPFRKRDRVARFAIGRGYEPELVWSILKELKAG